MFATVAGALPHVRDVQRDKAREHHRTGRRRRGRVVPRRRDRSDTDRGPVRVTRRLHLPVHGGGARHRTLARLCHGIPGVPDVRVAPSVRHLGVSVGAVCYCWAQSVDMHDPWIALRNLWIPSLPGIHGSRRNLQMALARSTDLPVLCTDLTLISLL